MIKFEHTDVMNFDNAIRGMRNPLASWDKSDSVFSTGGDNSGTDCNCDCRLDIPVIGKNDLNHTNQADFCDSVFFASFLIEYLLKNSI